LTPKTWVEVLRLGTPPRPELVLCDMLSAPGSDDVPAPATLAASARLGSDVARPTGNWSNLGNGLAAAPSAASDPRSEDLLGSLEEEFASEKYRT
jgi:hypothetical protein